MTPSFAGSSPAIPATSSGQSPLCSEHPAGIPRSAPLPLLSKRDPLRSRWRLCRLTDAAYPLRVLRWARVWEPPAAALKTLSCNYTFDPLAQPVEQLPFKPWVRGSNPRRVTTSEQSPLCSGIFLQKTPSTALGSSLVPRDKPHISAATFLKVRAPAIRIMELEKLANILVEINAVIW